MPVGGMSYVTDVDTLKGVCCPLPLKHKTIFLMYKLSFVFEILSWEINFVH